MALHEDTRDAWGASDAGLKRVVHLIATQFDGDTVAFLRSIPSTQQTVEEPTSRCSAIHRILKVSGRGNP